MKLVLACEHATWRVPARLRAAMRGARRALRTHRGYDKGALPLARRLAKAFGAPLVAATASRLVVDANRSLGHPRLFSEWTRKLPAGERQRILDEHWRPYRARVEALVAARLARGARVLHLSVHSFSPRLEGSSRRVDVGLLYDPRRPLEVAVCRAFKRALARRLPHLRIRANQPYLGVSDGLTTELRTRFPAGRYAGVELEMSQDLVARGGRRWRELMAAVEAAVREPLAEGR